MYHEDDSKIPRWLQVQRPFQLSRKRQEWFNLAFHSISYIKQNLSAPYREMSKHLIRRWFVPSRFPGGWRIEKDILFLVRASETLVWSRARFRWLVYVQCRPRLYVTFESSLRSKLWLVSFDTWISESSVIGICNVRATVKRDREISFCFYTIDKCSCIHILQLKGFTLQSCSRSLVQTF